MAKNLEIERRYLATGCRLAELKGPRMQIVQGYLDEPGASKRVRVINGKRAVITVKRGKGLVREEYETDFPLDEAYRLLATTEAVISKTRIKQDGWDVDIFDSPFGAPEYGRPLVVAEYEMESADEVVTIPDWLGEVVEVTTYMESGLLAGFLKEIKGNGAKVSPRTATNQMATMLAELIFPRDSARFAKYVEEQASKPQSP